MSTSAAQPQWLEDVKRMDAAVYAAVAATHTPTLDRELSRLSRAADYSRLWIGSSALLMLFGGRDGARAAALGLGSVAVTATLVNAAMKPLGRRRRPDREADGVPAARHVPIPASSSFPSGHSAAAFAFATGVGHTLPQIAAPIHALAALVAYSRVHTGVHYPGDVVVGALLGAVLAQVTTRALDPRLTTYMSRARGCRPTPIRQRALLPRRRALGNFEPWARAANARAMQALRRPE